MFGATRAAKKHAGRSRPRCPIKNLRPAALQSAPTHQCDDAKDSFVPQNVPMMAVARAAFKSSFSVLTVLT